jgi:SHS2 domain-containing protein
MKKYEFLEHVADAYIAAYGLTLEEAFENAALAMFEVMTDTNLIKQKTKNLFNISGQDECALLYNWLEKLLVTFELRCMLYSKFKIEKIEKTGRGYKFRALAFGEKFDQRIHLVRTGIKAVTYHRMSVEKAGENVVVKFILDL